MHLLGSCLATTGPFGGLDGDNPRSLPSEVIHSVGMHGQVVEPIADACEDNRIWLLPVVLNHSSCELAPVGNRLPGKETYDQGPNDAAVSSPAPNAPAAPSVTVLYVAVPPRNWFTAWLTPVSPKRQ